MTAALAVQGLRKVYHRAGGGTFVAVDDLSFSVEAGQCLALVGESGSGKTTTARMLIGQELPTAGTIRVRGEIWRTSRRSGRDRRQRGRQVQMVFQDPYTSLDPRQGVGSAINEILRLHTALDRAGRRERLRELLDSVGLEERHARTRPANLSGGQRQRVAIAKALAAAPSVLILDEAVSALDVSIQAQILNLLMDIRAQTSVAYLFISHDLAVVRQVADDVLVLQRGRTVEHGSTTAVLDTPQHTYTRLLRSCVPHPGWVPKRVQRPPIP